MPRSPGNYQLGLTAVLAASVTAVFIIGETAPRALAIQVLFAVPLFLAGSRLRRRSAIFVGLLALLLCGLDAALNFAHWTVYDGLGFLMLVVVGWWAIRTGIDNARLRQVRAEAADAEKLVAENRAILGQIADGVVIADATGQITFVNQAADRHYHMNKAGTRIAGLAGAGMLPVKPGEGCLPADLALARAIVHQEIVLGSEICIPRPGGDIVALVSATPVIAEDGTSLGGVMTLHDVTAQRTLEREKDEFFANVSHDLRTPLAAIMSSIGIVLANEPPGMPEPLHRLLKNIELGADRLAGLVDNLLELTRLQVGRVQLQLDSHDLRELAQSSARAIEPLASARGQRVQVCLPDDPVPANVDRERLERALVNLLSNAHKYSPAGGTIRLTLEAHPAEACIMVADDGPGIPLAEQERIFERFYRSLSNGSRDNRGSGLGLPIARAMVELHGGRISVQSEPGVGSVFCIMVPLSSQRAGSYSSSAIRPGRGPI